MQKHWPPGTQCITKHDHTKPKAQELAVRKGDVVTIVEAAEVSPDPPQGGHRAGGTQVPATEPAECPLLSLALRPSPPQGKGWYRARHNETGQEGLLAGSILRQRGAIRVDPKLSLMP